MDTHSGIVAWRITWTEEPVAYHPWSLKESDMTEQQRCSALVVINLFFYLNSFTLVYLCIYIVCMYICMYVLYVCIFVCMYCMHIYHLILKLVGKRDYNLSIFSNFMISYLFFNKDF